MTAQIDGMSAFLRECDEFVAQTRGDIDQTKRAVAIAVLSGVDAKMPVKTGRARANTQTSAGQPAEGALDAVDPAGGIALGRGVAVIGNAQVEAPIWITNNLPYIERLENGWSDQAPRGMFAVTLEEVRTAFQGAITVEASP